MMWKAWLNTRGTSAGSRTVTAHCHRPCDRLDVDGLKILLVQARTWRLSGDAEDRDRIRNRRIKTRDHVGPGRTRSADADADIAGLGAGVAFGHMGSALDVTGENVGDRSALLQRRIKRIDRSARHAERANDTFLLQNPDRRIDRSHLRHLAASLACAAAASLKCARDLNRMLSAFPRCGRAEKNAALSTA